MKILIQNSVFFPNIIGGAEVSSHLLGQELRARGVAADAVATTGRLGGERGISTRPTADGLGTVYEAAAHGHCDIFGPEGIPPQPHIVTRGLHHFSMVYSRRWKAAFAEVLESSRPDILHTNTIVGMTPAIWAAAHARGIPVVHTLRDYHLLCPRTTLLRSDKTDCEDPPLPCRILADLKLRQTHRVQVVTAPSRFVLDRHLRAGGFSMARPEVVPNACEHIPHRIPDRDTTGPVRGLFLGQMDEHKGVLLLRDALQKLFSEPELRPLEFDFAGVGPCVGAIEDLCRRFPERSRYHGVVRGVDKARLLEQVHFLVVPSLWNDNFPRSILDGFSHGLPVIGTDRGGIPEVIRDGLEGRVVPCDERALAEAITDYVTGAELRLAHGMAARKRAEDFTLDRQVDRFQEIYSRLLDSHAEGRATPSR